MCIRDSYQWVGGSRHVFAVHRLVHFQWNQRPPKHPWFRQKGTSICVLSLSELSDIMIWAMSESPASFKTTMSHATTRVSSDIDVKRPENHQGIVSTRFNFNIPQERPIAVVKTKLYTKREKTFALSFCYMYAMMRFAEESDCRLLTWLYGAKIPCTIEKIC